MKAFIEKLTAQTLRNVMTRAYRHAEAAIAEGGMFEVVIRRTLKSRDQEEKYHCLIADIADQYDHFGRRWHKDDMKRLLVDAFKHETANDPVNYPGFDQLWKQMGDMRLVPAIGRDGFVALGDQTRRFPAKLANGFITWLLAFGGENGVIWTDPEYRSQMAQSEMARAA